MLKIRLSRKGTKKRPFYHIVVADSRYPRDGRFIEKVGTYNPMLPKDSEQRLIMNLESIKSWIAKGAQSTDRVTKFLSDAKVCEPRTIYAQTKQDKPKPKTVARAAEKAAKIADFEAVKKQAEADAQAAIAAAKQAEIEAKEAAKQAEIEAKEAVTETAEMLNTQDTVSEIIQEAETTEVVKEAEVEVIEEVKTAEISDAQDTATEITQEAKAE